MSFTNPAVCEYTVSAAPKADRNGDVNHEFHGLCDEADSLRQRIDKASTDEQRSEENRRRTVRVNMDRRHAARKPIDRA